MTKEYVSDFEPKENTHYKIIEHGGHGYYQCLNCHKLFKKRYLAKRISAMQKRYGTAQLLALWSWHNFQRHLKACYKSCTPIPKEKKK